MSDDQNSEFSALTSALVGLGGAVVVFGGLHYLAGRSEKKFEALQLPDGGGVLLEKGDPGRPTPGFSALTLPRIPARITRATQRLETAKTEAEQHEALDRFMNLWEKWEGREAWEGESPEFRTARPKTKPSEPREATKPPSARTKARMKLEAAQQRLRKAEERWRASQRNKSTSSPPVTPAPQAEIVEFHPELARLQKNMSQQAREEANQEARAVAKGLGVSDWQSFLADIMNIQYAVARGAWSDAEHYADKLSKSTGVDRKDFLEMTKKASADRVRKMVEDQTGVSMSEVGDAAFLRRTPFRVIPGNRKE